MWYFLLLSTVDILYFGFYRIVSLIGVTFTQGQTQDFKLAGPEYKEKKTPNRHSYSIKKIINT